MVENIVEIFEKYKKVLPRRSMSKDKALALNEAILSGKIELKRREGTLEKPEGSRRFDDNLWQYGEYESVDVITYLDTLAMNKTGLMLDYKHLKLGLYPFRLQYAANGCRYRVEFLFDLKEDV